MEIPAPFLDMTSTIDKLSELKIMSFYSKTKTYDKNLIDCVNNNPESINVFWHKCEFDDETKRLIRVCEANTGNESSVSVKVQLMECYDPSVYPSNSIICRIILNSTSFLGYNLIHKDFNSLNEYKHEFEELAKKYLRDYLNDEICPHRRKSFSVIVKENNLRLPSVFVCG